LNRNFTAREGARLQSFPDSYIFMGRRTTMSWEKSLSQYQQIGNAVPPLLAKAIAENLNEYFARIDFISEDGTQRRGLQMALLEKTN
jgi:DNA (cytosine-5)-methyltransferase 1